MSLGLVVLVGGTLVITLSAIGFLIWGITTKQFKNVEDAKYTMLEDKEPISWPKQEGDES